MNDIEALTKKSDDSILVAEVLLQKNLYGFSISRSYYAMFYLAEALLLSKNLAYSTHNSVISSFGREFIKTGIFDKKFGEGINKAYDLQENGDYEPQDKVTEQQANTCLNLAKEFLESAKKYLREK
jgi:uncharacterized protein (UPF0332 family)